MRFAISPRFDLDELILNVMIYERHGFWLSNRGGFIIFIITEPIWEKLFLPFHS